MLRLPVRIVTGRPEEPVVGVDGSTGAPGLELSHWPGHRTPLALRHDLSTGCALAFARLRPAERARLTRGATAIVNNHYDTDGALALFAVSRPESALPHARRMLAAARAGDFYRAPDEAALALDALVIGLSDVRRSPLSDRLAGATDVERWQLCIDHLMEAFPALLAGDMDDHRELWEPVVEDARHDRADLESARRNEDHELDLAVWTASRGSTSSRAKRCATFDPGRHALFGATGRDRVLVIGPQEGGVSYRLVVSTLSWFDLVTEERLPRPDLVPLAARLNELERSGPDEEHAWRAQPLRNASPELWFGRETLEPFAEHNESLGLSRLDPRAVRAEVERCLRGLGGFR